jgi:hypothetical protein
MILEDVFVNWSEKDKVRELQEMLVQADWKGLNLLLCLDLRFGLKTIDPKLLQPFNSFFQRPSSLGVIGGIKSRGLYFFGSAPAKNKFYFIDPHYTDNSQASKLSQESSWAKTFFSTCYGKINPSFCVFFLLKSGKDFETLLKLAADIKRISDVEIFSPSVSNLK